MATVMATPRRLDILTLYRGIAATLVVLFHYTAAVGQPYYFGLPSWTPMMPEGRTNGLFDFGHSGVDFFFVLSGFVMVWGYGRDGGRVRALWPYLTARFARIYPTY